MPGQRLDALHALARDAGVELAYADIDGVERIADPAVLVAVLRALRIPLDFPSEAADILRERERDRATRLLPTVTVIEEGTPFEAELTLPAGETDAVLLCILEHEDALTRVEWRARAGELTTVAGDEADGRTLVRRRLPLPQELPFGYHRLSVHLRQASSSTHVIVAPARGARSRPHGDRPAYGLFAPVHALRSGRSWGAGDLTDLDAVAAWGAGEGAEVVMTLPLLAGFAGEPCEPSPYLPLSRQFFHELWIDVERIPEIGWSPRARALAADPAAARERAALRAGRLVDLRQTMAAKRAVIEACAAALGTAPSGRENAFRAHALEHPDVLEYARFRAAGERFGADWTRWPPALRNGAIRWADIDPEVERYYSYAQFVVREQLGDLVRRLRSRGQALALDLPLGVHPWGYDTWRHREQFALGLSVGAPPDPLGPAGQAWGFPPPHPAAIARDGFAQLRACLAAHLRLARILRIDHVMGLRRLFVVPDGAGPADGVYLRLPEDALFAVACVEAARHAADLVGEDLGLVEPELRARMERHGLRRMDVARFSLTTAEPADPPPGSLASFATHDLATFAGWWTGADLDERLALGLDTKEQSAERRAAREVERERLAAAVGADAGDAAPEVLKALLAHLAASEAGVVVVGVDDLLGQVEAQNVPGTTDERPNWRIALPRPVEELTADPSVHDVLAPLREARRLPGAAATARLGRAPETVYGVSLLDDTDLHLFNEGRHFRLYRKLGAHPIEAGGVQGTFFAVWAPNATGVSVIGDFNGWDGSRHPLRPRGQSGTWEGFVPGVGRGARYKYRIAPRYGGGPVDKADPFAFAAECPPATASIVADLDRTWTDAEWLRRRGERQRTGSPISIYEVHLGSWRPPAQADWRFPSYAELAPQLAAYAKELAFTHVQLLPVMEHPFYGSWGYQTTGYFAPTARYGPPQELMGLIETLHGEGIGVLLDWVPSHFPSDAHGLAAFDGTHLYEHADPRQRVHPDWLSWIFNYGRNEVRSFLVSSALFWLDRYHADGLRLDAVASMLYLDYSRREGEWVPNRYGGRENLEALELLRACNEAVYAEYPDAITIAEESTAWPGVSRPTWAGGLGFGYKWDLGWMHDTLEYLARDPVHRRHHQDELTFRGLYATTENFVLPLSHDEVVHGKGSLLARLPGDRWQQLANLRLLLAYQTATPGKKLLFMGGEIAQEREWDHERFLDWELLERPEHAGVQRFVAALNRLYATEPALHELDSEGEGCRWIDCSDREHSVIVLERRSREGAAVVAAFNFTPVPRRDYRIGLPGPGVWEVVLSGDAAEFGGSGHEAPAAYPAEGTPFHGRSHSAGVVLPPLAAVFLRRRG